MSDPGSELSPNTIAAWARIARLDPAAVGAFALTAAAAAAESHHAFVSLSHDAPATPRSGLLSGVPFAVKDNIDIAGLPTTAGSQVLASFLPAKDAGAASPLRGAGAWCVGKTNLHELAFGVTSNNAAFGAVRHPWDPDASPGGSSGGSAVAVALGVVPFALGTDTGGSMTIPAALCGVVGYRPSTGRYPADGLVRLSSTRDTVGVMATTVLDIRLVDDVIRGRAAGTDPDSARVRRRRPWRLGVVAEHLRDLEGAVHAAVVSALDRLADSGLDVVEVSAAAILDDARLHGPVVVAHEATAELSAALARLDRAGSSRGTPLTITDLAAGTRSPDVRALLSELLTHPVSETSHRAALQKRDRLRQVHRTLLDRRDLDALIYPTTPALAPALGADEVRIAEHLLPVFPTLTRHTEAGAFLGAPSVSLPLVQGRRRPHVGLNIEGRIGDDDALLTLATHLQTLTTRVEARTP